VDLAGLTTGRGGDRMLMKNSLGKTINTFDDWEAYSSPTTKKHNWVDGKSTKELAKVWMRNGTGQIPDELTSLFNSAPELGHVEINLAIPECKTKIDQYGTHRLHDLLLYGKNDHDKIVISIEAMIDESFGPTIKDRKANNREHSNMDKRIARLTQALFYKKDVSHIKYQLLLALGGTLVEAKKHKASFAVFVIHEFVSSSLDPDIIQKNTEDLNEFVSCLINKPFFFDYGELMGPYYLPGGEDISRDTPIYIGKIKTDCVIAKEKRYRKMAIRL
jgi:hypothetical protein